MTTAENSGRRKKKCIALFNFDDTFSLDSAEDLLRATKTKVDFEISIAKHYFPLCVMPELCKSIIPKLEMDVAVFVINANESCLIINSKKSDRGYTKMYKALLQATGDKVLLVIGGDDNYKSQAERDSNVLSAWAKRIMQSQLDEQFLDGRKSFVFSWDKKHRKIHEQALLHYFDPQNVGLKKFKHVLSQDAKLATVSNEKTKETEGNSEQNQLGDDAGNDKSSGRDKEEDESCNRDNYDMSDVSQHSQTGTFDNGTRKREELPSNKEMPYSALGASAKVQDLVILGCNASDESVSAVYQVIQDLKPKLNLKSDPPIVTQPPGELKSYLMGNKVKFCLLVVDAEAVKNAFKNSQQRMEYEEVLKTASDKVVRENVIVAICGPPIFPESDEATVTQAINSTLLRNNNGFLVWLKGGKLQMSREVLLGMLPESVQKTSELAGDVRPTHEYPVTSSSYFRAPGYLHGERTQRGLTRIQSVDSPSNQPHNQLSRDGTIKSPSADGGEAIATQSSNLTGVQRGWVYPLKGEIVRLMMKVHLRNGKISEEDGDFSSPCWTVPDYIQADLMSKHSNTSEAELLIFYDESGTLRSSVTPKRGFCLLS